MTIVFNSSSSGANMRDPRSANFSSGAVDPRLRGTSVKPPDAADISVSLQPPESPTSPASPPTAADNEVNVAGLRVAYLLRRLTISVQPLCIPAHVNVDELKQRSDPRLSRYQLARCGSAGAMRRPSAADSPGRDKSGGEMTRRRSPSLYTLPDIVLPPIPIRAVGDDGMSGTSALRKDYQSSSIVKLPEALLERNFTPQADTLLLQRQSSTASSDSDSSCPKKVVDYRNDPRYKKKKTLNVSREEVAKSSAPTGLDSDDRRETFVAGFYGAGNDDDDPSVNLTDYRAFNRCEGARGEIGSNWDNDDRSTSPLPSSSFSASSQSSCFLPLTVANTSATEVDEETDEQVSLKDMFKTIDPTTSPFC
jgi:hypothetical protein